MGDSAAVMAAKGTRPVCGASHAARTCTAEKPRMTASTAVRKKNTMAPLRRTVSSPRSAA